MRLHLRHNDKYYECELTLLPVEDVYPHEEIVEASLRKLVKAIEASGYIDHPILVDRDSNVVLDGMHRLAASKVLGFDLVPVFKIPYEIVKLDVRVRHIRDRTREAKLKEFEDSSGERIVYGQETFRISEEGVKILDAEYGKENMQFLHYKEPDILAVMPYKLSKEQVVKRALSGRLFPAKTTRHVMPARPLFVTIPIRFLKGGEERIEEFNRWILRKRVLRIRGGITLDRHYEEETLFVFV